MEEETDKWTRLPQINELAIVNDEVYIAVIVWEVVEELSSKKNKKKKKKTAKRAEKGKSKAPPKD